MRFLMNKKTPSKEPSLKKEHFEILLEDLEDKFKFVVEAVAGMRESLTARIDNLSDKLDATREELIFLMKATAERSEGRLTQKIDGVEEKLTKEIHEVRDILVVHSDRLADHDERISNLEKRP